MSVPGTVPTVSPDLPSAAWRATLAVLQRMPQAALSRSLGRVADIPIPQSMRRTMLGAAARALGIDMGEAELPLEAYGSLNALFVRRLRSDARPVTEDPATIVSPVDGVIGQNGAVRAGRLIQAKGRDYSVAALLDDESEAERYEGGTFITIYLSPRHYHRIHAPCSGTIPCARHVPGALLPVNEPAVLHVADLFPRNERVICSIDGALGRTAVVAVGAYNVGRISTTFDPDWVGPGVSVANRRGARPTTRAYDPPRTTTQGEEIMAFHLGSTIVALCEPGLTLQVPEPGSEIRLGDIVARRRRGLQRTGA